MAANSVQFPDKLRFLFRPHRYKVSWGGRGSAKSWSYARALLIKAAERKKRVLCARETQKSIEESVYHLLCEQIELLGLQSVFEISKSKIIAANGSEFAFQGIRQNIHNVKSFEGFDIVWVEEAHTVTKTSWDVLIPTIRKEGSEIWVTFNPELETDETYQRFVIHSDKLAKIQGTDEVDAVVVKVNYTDNPWFPEILRSEMEACRAKSEDDYLHIWEGHCKQVVEGAIYRSELIAADSQNRITRVPYDAIAPVHTFWDLGFGDNTSIWFAQSIGFEFRIIDFLNDSLKDVGWYLKQLQEKPYIYGTHHLPHDASAKTLAAGGRTVEQQVKAGGQKVKIVPKLSLVDGIAAVRNIFNKCYFDAEHCAEGLQALRHYRYEYDEELRTYKKDPLHDWASHPADAFRTLAVAIRDQERPPKRDDWPEQPSPGVWS